VLGIVLAAGKGTRMKSNIPKVMHKITGKPIISWVMDSLCRFFNEIDLSSDSSVCIVIGNDSEQLKDFIDTNYDSINPNYAVQEIRNGTGGAVISAKEYIKNAAGDDYVFVLNGDVPFITPDTLTKMRKKITDTSSDALILTVNMDDPSGYGRVIKEDEDEVKKIVEHKDATDEQRLVREINTGIYVYRAKSLLEALEKLNSNNAQNEYYITDTVTILKDMGKKVTSLVLENQYEVAGINDRVQLAELEKTVRENILEHHMKNGVTIIDPDNTYINIDVKIGMDTVIYPMTFIKSGCIIGDNCEIGPMSQIEECTIGNRCKIERSHLKGTEVCDDVSVGPFARLREGTRIEESCKIGDFVELKKTFMKKGSKAQHLSYLGDATIGENVNIGAGTITCNYDGYNKHKTIIGSNAFVGSNSSIVAPVCIGENALIAAGSVITEDVSEDALALGRSRQIEKKDRAKTIKEELKRQKEKRL